MIDFSKHEFIDEPFTLYFAGGWNRDVDLFLQEHNLNRLGSQLNERQLFNYWIHAKTEGCTSHLFVDSGAWTAHSKGKNLDIDEYIQYVNINDEHFYIIAQGDTIPGKFRQIKSYEDRIKAPESSWQNYLYMLPKLDSPCKLLPIFHQGEDFKWLHNMLDFTDDFGNHIPYIGLSPANDSGVPMKIEFLKRCFDIIRESSHPNVRTHAFGMTSLDVLEMFPLTSADSTSWIMCAANGGVYTPYGVVAISAKAPLSLNHYNMMQRKEKEVLHSYFNKLGFTVEELQNDYKARMKSNILYLMKWMKNYSYKEYSITNTLF